MPGADFAGCRARKNLARCRHRLCGAGCCWGLRSKRAIYFVGKDHFSDAKASPLKHIVRYKNSFFPCRCALRNFWKMILPETVFPNSTDKGLSQKKRIFPGVTSGISARYRCVAAQPGQLPVTPKNKTPLVSNWAILAKKGAIRY